MNHLGHSRNYLGSIFNYIGHNQKERAYNPVFGFAHPDFWRIGLLFPLDCSRNGTICSFDSDCFIVDLLTGMRIFGDSPVLASKQAIDKGGELTF